MVRLPPDRHIVPAFCTHSLHTSQVKSGRTVGDWAMQKPQGQRDRLFSGLPRSQRRLATLALSILGLCLLAGIALTILLLLVDAR